MTTAHKPPMKVSEEADEKQLDMAREQGKAYSHALKHMAKDVADDGNEKAAGEYIVAYAIEKAEGLYRMQDGELQWGEPDGNVHVEVSVRDAADNRFIPGLTVHATLIDPDGNEVGTHHQHFLWHPWLYHYGRNWQLEKSGQYTLKVKIDAPDFPRHDSKNGKRFAEDVEVTFSNVKVDLKSKSGKH